MFSGWLEMADNLENGIAYFNALSKAVLPDFLLSTRRNILVQDNQDTNEEMRFRFIGPNFDLFVGYTSCSLHWQDFEP